MVQNQPSNVRNCNYNGHTKEQCFKLIGYPPNWKKKKDIYSVSSSPAGQFRPLPKAIQANVSQSTIGGIDQIQQMQSQIN